LRELPAVILVRPADPGDAPAIAEVHVASWRETYVGIMPDHVLARQSVAMRTRMWQGILDRRHPAEANFVAEVEEDEIAGFASCGLQRTSGLDFAGEFYALYVRESHQRCGIGRTLMIAMSNHLRRLGLASASLWVVRENARAIRFYERFGGVRVAEQEDRGDGFVLTEFAYGWRRLPG
jgi:GNAT superfamily N-acetyltransferase